MVLESEKLSKEWSTSLKKALYLAITSGIFAWSPLFAKNAPASPKSGFILIGNGAEPKGLDSALINDVPASHIVDNLGEGLTTRDPITLQPRPGVAESWTLSADQKTYTFVLRKSARWSDGTALTAEDFRWSWIRALSHQLASPYAYQLYAIKNAEGFNTQKIKAEAQVGIKVLDSHTLQVELERPTAYFLYLTSFHTLYPTPRHVIEKYPDQEWTRAEHMVSNGAFKLEEWKLNQHIKIIANDKYWDYDRVKIEGAYFYPIENADTEARNFESGALHMTETVPSMKIPMHKKEIAKSPTAYHSFKITPYLGTYFYRLNTKKPPLNDIRVRRALSLTIDRKLIVEHITKGGQLPSRSFTPPNTAGYTYPPTLPESVTEVEINEARTLLAQAGFPNGKGFPKLDLLYNNGEDHKKICVAIQQMWKKNLGIDVGLLNQEWKVFLNSVHTGDYAISRAGWIGDYPDPNTFLDLWMQNGGNNETFWSNPEYDRLIDLAAATVDTPARYAHFQKAEEILLQETPILPIYTYTKVSMISPKLKMLDHAGKQIEWTSNITQQIFLSYYMLTK